MIQSRLFLLRDKIHGALSDVKLCRMFSFTYSCVKANSHRTDKRQQTSLLEFVRSVCYLCWRWLVFVFTRLNMLIDIELVGVCWCSVNMTVIFQKILNPTANLSQLVCWSLLAFVCAVWIGLYTLHEKSFSKIHNRGTLNCNIISQYSYFYSIFDQICTVFLIKYADAVLVSISDIFQKHKNILLTPNFWTVEYIS